MTGKTWTTEDLYEVATKLVARLQKTSVKGALAKYEDNIQDMVLAAWERTQVKPIGRPIVEQEMKKVFIRAMEKERKRTHGDVPLDEMNDEPAVDPTALLDEHQDAKRALSEALEVLDATPLQRQVAAALVQFDMDRERTAVELRVSRATVDSVLQNLRTKAAKYAEAKAKHPAKGPAEDKPGVPDSGVAESSEGSPGGASKLSGLRYQASASSRSPLQRGVQRPGAPLPAVVVSELPRDFRDSRPEVTEPTDAGAPAPVVGPGPGQVVTAPGSSLTAETLMEFWVHRTNPYALMSPHGDGYYPVREELTLEVLERHLAGEHTVGVYSTTEDNTVRWVCWDIDELNTDMVMDLVMSVEGPYLVEFSGGKGYHVWQFFAEPVDAGSALSYGQRVAQAAGVQCEVFPKQADVKGGLGNLVKLPGGVHRKTGARAEVQQGELAYIPAPTGEAHAAKGEPAASTHNGAEVSGWIEEMFAGGLGEGGRNNTLNRFVAWLLSRGLPPDVVENTVRFVNESYCEPPLDDDELSVLLRPRRFAA